MQRFGAFALFLATLLGSASAFSQDAQPLVEVSPLITEAPQDTIVIDGSDESLASRERHKLTVDGKPSTRDEIGLWGWTGKARWVMATPGAGQYIVSLALVSGNKRPGKFGYTAGDKEILSNEIREAGAWTGCSKAFRITVPEGQTETPTLVTGDGFYLFRADIAKVTKPAGDADGKITVLAEASYRTVFRGTDDKPRCVVLAPAEGIEAKLAKRLAERLKLPLAAEPELQTPFPAFPAVAGATSDTNLILLSAGQGGPLVRAMRRAGLIAENHAVPGPGGYVIRTVARAFAGRGNVIVISSGDEAGLAGGIEALSPEADAKTGEIVWNKFLLDSPSERWKKLRPYYYRIRDDEDYWRQKSTALDKPFAGLGGYAPARAYISTTDEWADRYWLTGNDKFAELFKRYVFKMEDDAIYASEGKDSHMELYGLMRGWDRVEESPAFSTADRLRIANYLLRCVEGPEGFGGSYGSYTVYSGPVRMRHNHQTIRGCGMMQAYLYYGRLYGLGRVQIWKSWCDGLITEATAWGHAPENSPNYEPRTFLEQGDMIRCQGLSTKGPEGTKLWPEAAMRFMAWRDSFGLPACYGDCWANDEFQSMEFLEALRDDWDWPAAQFAIDRMIRGYRIAAPKSMPASDLYAYLHGSTDVGGLLKPSDPAAAEKALSPLVGLAALPMGEGYWRYMTGQVGQREFWTKPKPKPKPEIIPYERTADKVQYRSGWGMSDEYLLFETIGWADHGHIDLGSIVQYCAAGRLWIVDFGYNNVGPEHHSTLEVKRDGKAAWHKYEGEGGRWGDFLAGPQMFEIVEFKGPGPGTPGPFRVTGQAHDLAGATWKRTVSGGDGKGLVIEDTLAADEPGEYEATFRLRLLGKVEGALGDWTVRQKDATLPVKLNVAPGDVVAIGKWLPDDHAEKAGAYPWYPFADPASGASSGGTPKTIEWTRKVKLDRGQTCVFRAALGPVIPAK